jgi:hypothetical protein
MTNHRMVSCLSYLTTSTSAVCDALMHGFVDGDGIVCRFRWERRSKVRQFELSQPRTTIDLLGGSPDEVETTQAPGHNGGARSFLLGRLVSSQMPQQGREAKTDTSERPLPSSEPLTVRPQQEAVGRLKWNRSTLRVSFSLALSRIESAIFIQTRTTLSMKFHQFDCMRIALSALSQSQYNAAHTSAAYTTARHGGDD